MNRLERMNKSGQLPFPKATKKLNNDKTPLGDHESIFDIYNQI